MIQQLCKFSLLALALTVSACASTTTNSSGVTVLSASAYESLVDKWSDRIESYNGLSNTVTIHATLLGTEMALGQVDQSARQYQWDQITYDNEKKKVQDQLARETQVFVSFYSPERKWDDLYKSKTLWKVFLDVGGQRYEGKITKVKLLMPEIRSLYHYHSAFGTPYSISFPIPAAKLEGQSVRMVFTGAIDSVTLNFDRR